jgi:hypothetical protein
VPSSKASSRSQRKFQQNLIYYLTAEPTDDERMGKFTVEGSTAAKAATMQPPAVPKTTFEINRPTAVPLEGEKTHKDTDNFLVTV